MCFYRLRAVLNLQNMVLLRCPLMMIQMTTGAPSADATVFNGKLSRSEMRSQTMAKMAPVSAMAIHILRWIMVLNHERMR